MLVPRSPIRDGGAPMGDDVTGRLQLLDWRRRIAELYAAVRADDDYERGWHRWCDTRRLLFLEHPQSPLPPPDRNGARAPSYYPYDPSCRLTAPVLASNENMGAVPSSTGGDTPTTRAGTIQITLANETRTLQLHWLQDYAGGLLLMCRDATSGTETYGAGRYVLDTAKSADLGVQDGRLVVDFNFAYQPSCSYDPRWHCPLPPRANWLDIPIRAGERL